MGLECMIVLAHAFGRTLVVPPQQHLYLLGQAHKGTNTVYDLINYLFIYLFIYLNDLLYTCN